MSDGKGGRKYFVADVDKWNDFKASAMSEATSLIEAKSAANDLAVESSKENPGAEHGFVIIEEAGFLRNQVSTKVESSFSSSRKSYRTKKVKAAEGEGDSDSQAGEEGGADTDTAGSGEVSRQGKKKGRNR